MTKMGMEHFIQLIKDRIIEPPTNMSVDQLTAWLDGYATCQNDIMDILKEIMEDS